MRLSVLLRGSLTALLVCISVRVCYAASGEELYRAGRIEEARAAFEKSLIAARESHNQRSLWWALMQLAWFEDETSNHRTSLRLSDEALEVATKLGDSFMTGRSLIWLGWAYSSMGRYKTALEFYSEALKIGAPNGKIEIVPVWGFAQQELGALYYRMGDLTAAREALERTLNYARENEITVGIAEGAAELAEVALTQGNQSEAENLAKEAVKAAVECGCSPFNTARAKVVLAKILVAKAKIHSDYRREARLKVDEALETAAKTGNVRIQAEAKLLVAQLTPATAVAEKLRLLNEAVDILERHESELRGVAHAALGEAYAQNDNLLTAAQYIGKGFGISEAALREIDRAYILSSFATLYQLSGDTRHEFEALAAAADDALSRGNLSLALDQQRKLAVRLEETGYTKLALKWAKLALETSAKLLLRDADLKIRTERQLDQVKLAELVASLEIELAAATALPR